MNTFLRFCHCLLLLLLMTWGMAAESGKTLHVHSSGRFLCWDDGKPFFYLGDTAWELFHRLNREEADIYLTDRATKGFTVIQASVLAELNGLKDPNPYGEVPLIDCDPLKPNEAYFEHVDYIVNKAESLGLCIAMLPTWGDKWNLMWGDGPVIFTPDNAKKYGEFLGKRYRDKPIIWMLGGDRPIDNDQHRAIVSEMAAGLKAGDGGRNLMTMHTCAKLHTSQYFHNDDWLNFNTVQTGHKFNFQNFENVSKDYNLTPIKPIIDAEPGYEDHPSAFKAENGYLDDVQVRKFAYWAVFAGAFGHTYGCHDIWQFWQPGRKPITFARTPWQQAMLLPGSQQVGFTRALIESRPFFTRVPDQKLLASGPKKGKDYVAITSDRNAQDKATYILAYMPSTTPIVLNTSIIDDKNLTIWWYDPRNGEATSMGEVPNTGSYTPPKQTTPGDWVLVIDATSAKYVRPGDVSWRITTPAKLAP